MPETKGEMTGYLDYAVNNNASDIHLIVGIGAIVRIDGKLLPIPDGPEINGQRIRSLLESFVPAPIMKTLEEKKEVDFSFGYKDFRFRANVYYQKGYEAASLRLIPKKIKSIDELGLPPILEKFAEHSQGFVIFTGPTGSGKSTSLASLIDRINQDQTKHIITIEDPIEYVFEHRRSIVSQREIGTDSQSFSRALRSALREDPDVVLVGEMRDLETIEAALTIAETGHLVLTTLHTNSSSQTADRIINVFPSHLRQQVANQLAAVLVGVVSQRLIPKVGGGRIVAAEIMMANSAVKSLIRDGKTYQIPNVIQTSAGEGMVSLDKILAEYVSRGEITMEDALTWSIDPKNFKTMIY